MNLTTLLTHMIDVNGRQTLHEHPGYGVITTSTKTRTPGPILVSGAELLERMSRAQRMISHLTQGLRDTQAILDEVMGTTITRAPDAPIAASPIPWPFGPEKKEPLHVVRVSTEGVQFGNAWYSHERITGLTAEQLNGGGGGVTGRAYMAWVNSLDQTLGAGYGADQQSLQVPTDKHERAELRKRIMAAMTPLCKNHDYWEGWPGSWSFAEAALQVIEAEIEERNHE